MRGDRDDVGRVAAARALGVVRVDRPAADGAERRLDVAGLVEGVGVQGDRHAGRVGDAKAGVDGRGGGPPVLVQLETRRSGAQLLPQRVLADRVALAEQGDVHRPGVERLQHPGDVPGAGDGGGLGPFRRAGPAADEGGDPGPERLLQEPRADQVDVGVHGSRGQDAPVAGEDLGGRPDDQFRVDAVHRVGVPGLPERDDPAVADPEVGLHDAPVVQDHGAGDDHVERAVRAGGARLPHRLADHLPAAEEHLVTGARTAAAVLGDLDEQVGVGQPDPVSGGGASGTPPGWAGLPC